jgi:hypothetical protein
MHEEDNEMLFDSIKSQENETFNKAFEVNHILKNTEKTFTVLGTGNEYGIRRIE